MSAVYKEIRHFLAWVDPVILNYQFQLTKEDTVSWMSRIVLVVKNPPANAGHVKDVGSISGLGRSPGGGLAPHFSILAWRIPWPEEPDGLQSTW